MYEHIDGPPKPSADLARLVSGLAVLSAGVLAAGGLWVATGGFATETRGATRSVKLQWEQRQDEIARAAARQGMVTSEDGGQRPTIEVLE
jgi:hypothetical protein